MSLKPLIIAVGVCVNMIQGEMPSFFPWQQQGLCFLILSVLQSLGNSDTVAFKIFSQMVTEFILDFFQQDYDVFIANMPKQTFFLSVFMAFAHLQKHNPVFDFLGIGNVCFSSHYLKSLCKYLYPSTQNSIGLIFLSTKQFFTCH